MASRLSSAWRCWLTRVRLSWSGRRRQGMRTYIAVGGGVDVAPVLGSRSTDTLSGLGPPRAEDRHGVAHRLRAR